MKSKQIELIVSARKFLFNGLKKEVKLKLFKFIKGSKEHVHHAPYLNKTLCKQTIGFRTFVVNERNEVTCPHCLIVIMKQTAHKEKKIMILNKSKGKQVPLIMV